MNENSAALATQSITLSGYTHRYIDAGAGDETIFLVHGFSSSLDVFEKVVPLLAASRRVLALDLLGFGKSQKPLDVRYTLDFYADLMLEFLQKTNALGAGKKVFAAGHSMGGKYLLALALLRPNKLTKIVISNTDGFIYVPPVIRAASLWGVRHLLHKAISRPDFVRKTMGNVYHDPSHITPEHFQRNVEMLQSRENFDAMMALNRDYRFLDLRRTGLRKRLPELSLPVLILWGEQDKFIPPKYAAVAQREIPNATLRMIPDCGHVPMIEKPREFVELTSAFFNAV
jgi:pimeloyl-ACP methyl ester carboxylesterase